MNGQHFERPPSLWLFGVTTIDESIGIYLSPSHPEDEPNPIFWHWCRQAKPKPRWYGMRTPLHEVISTDPWHLEPSLLCDHCGLHGYIRNGRWTPA